MRERLEENGTQTTRERIVATALSLFSEKGYGAVSVREIAGAVGIRESSLYYHFKNKQDIFDTIVEYCFKKAELYFRTNSLPFAKEDDLSVFEEAELSRLEKLLFSTFGYFFEDSWNIRFRRLLTVNQYENEKAKDIYRSLYRDYPIEFQRKLFARLMERGEFLEMDPETAALEFYGPIFLLIHTCDGLDEARERLQKHIRQFVKLYRVPTGTMTENTRVEEALGQEEIQ